MKRLFRPLPALLLGLVATFAGGSALATPTTGAGTPTPVAPAVQPAAPVRGAPVMVTPQR